MNNRAIIFQRSSVGSKADRQAELETLEAYAEQHDLKPMSVYVASGEPNILTIDMLINRTFAWAKPGHVLVSDLNRLWVGDGIAQVLKLLESAGAIVHVVPREVS